MRTGLLYRDIDAVMPDRADELGPRPEDRDLYREQPVSERTINRLPRFRRIAPRDEGLTTSSMAIETIARILSWLSPCTRAVGGSLDSQYRRASPNAPFNVSHVV